MVAVASSNASQTPAPEVGQGRTAVNAVSAKVEPGSPVAAPEPDAVQPPAASQAMPTVAAYTLPLDELTQVATQSGLVWVNSDAQKVAAIQIAIAAEPKPVRVPRERPPAVQMDERPLVLVETRLDLRDITLPFEDIKPN